MFPARIKDRATFILEVVDQQQTASYESLAEMLQVSTMTVRRDCHGLERTGKVIKTIGGIQQANAPSYLYETPVRERFSTNRAEKHVIAAKALDLISNNQTIFVDGGTTNLNPSTLVAGQDAAVFLGGFLMIHRIIHARQNNSSTIGTINTARADRSVSTTGSE